MTEDGYKLLTSKTDKPVACPDNDIVGRRINADEVEILFTKYVKVTKS